MVDFVLSIRSELVWDLREFRNIFMLRGLDSPEPPLAYPITNYIGGFNPKLGSSHPTFGLNPPRQLVIGYDFSESGSPKSLGP